MRAHNGVDPEFEATEDYLRADAAPRLGTKAEGNLRRMGISL